MKNKLILIIISFCSILYSQDYAKYVNPFIGTNRAGGTNPGAVVPWGLASVSPYNVFDTARYKDMYSIRQNSPYVSGKPFISGFCHVNLSGTGCQDMGTVLIMPTTGKVFFKPEKYFSAYSNEIALPGYYSVLLNRYNIKSEITSTTRSALCRFIFPQGESNIIINLSGGVGHQRGGFIRIVNDSTIEGIKMVGDFCNIWNAQTLYFYMIISHKPEKIEYFQNEKNYSKDLKELMGDNLGVYLNYNTLNNDSIEVRTGISFVSIENAKLNVTTESLSKSFNQIKDNAYNLWNKELSKIEVEGGAENDKIIFYTGLYHILLHPNIFQDVNGEYPAMENYKTTKAIGYNRYTLFSLWDTYRNVHPFLSLVYPKQQSDIVKSMLAMYKENGWLPKWELMSMETFVMVGDPAIPVIADSYLRGIKDFDTELAFEAMKKGAIAKEDINTLRPGIDSYIKYGYIPQDEITVRKVWGAVSTTLEYNIADYSLSQYAKALGKQDDYKLFYSRSLFYKNLFNKENGFMQPRLKNGSWMSKFTPIPDTIRFYPGQPGFVEGASWNYTFMVPHDIPGLIKEFGSTKKFIEQLQMSFDSGYYMMENEPDIAYPYLFNYVKGEEWRTQKMVRQCLRRNYSNEPRGINGNDDCGTMSAWMIYAMMGFYPDCPANMNYQITSPVFDKIVIHLDSNYYSGKTFTIETQNNSNKNIYIQQMFLNGKEKKDYTINHESITKGGILKIVLSNIK